MRDPKRIDEITQLLNEAWHRPENEDMRFWQLLINIDWKWNGDAWFMEDDHVKEVLDKVAKEGL